MTDDRLRTLYQQALRRRTAATDIAPERLEALAAGTLPERERQALLDRVMADEGLRREYELLRSVHTAGEAEGAASQRVSTGADRRAWYLGLGLAASLFFTVGIWYAGRGTSDPADRMRGIPAALTLHSPPAGSAVRMPVLLAWAPVEGATSYRVELVNDAGATVLTRQTADTAITLEAADDLAPANYRWWVEAEAPAGPVRSEFRAVRLLAP